MINLKNNIISNLHMTGRSSTGTLAEDLQRRNRRRRRHASTGEAGVRLRFI